MPKTADLDLPFIDSRESNEPSKNAEILELAKLRLADAMEYQRDNLKAADEDEAFVAGEQWDDSVLQTRINDRRPCLTLDQISPEIDKCVGQFMQSKVSMVAKPEDDATTAETADIYTAIIKHIEERSKAETVYAKQYQNIAIRGTSDFRIITEYEQDSFNQDIKLVPEEHTVYWDTDCLDDFKMDARWCAVTATISRRSFDEMYPDNAGGGSLTDEFCPEGVLKNQIRLTEYFYKEQYQETLVQMSDNSVLEEEDEDFDKKVKEAADRGIFVVNTRKQDCDRVIWCLMTNDVILEKRKLPIDMIPVIHVPGKVVRNRKRQKVEVSLVRRAKDPQRNYNYWRSAATEAVALAPKAPLLVTPEHIEGFEAQYANLHNENKPYLMYNPNPANPLDKPARLDGGVMPQGEVLLAQAAAGDIKACLGIDISMATARTGQAIDALQAPQDDGQYWLRANLKTALVNCGRTLLKYIPYIYDTERSLAVKKPDEQDKYVTINQTIGDKTFNEVKPGKLGVIVDIEEGARTMLQMAQKYMWQIINTAPQEGAKIIDLAVEGMGFPGAADIGARFRKTMSPLVAPGRTEEERKAQAEQQAAQQAQVMAVQKADAQKLMVDEHKNNILEQQMQLDKYKIDKQNEIDIMKMKLDYMTNQQVNQLKAQELGLKNQNASKDLEIKDFTAMSNHIQNMTPEVIQVDKKVDNVDVPNKK